MSSEREDLKVDPNKKFTPDKLDKAAAKLTAALLAAVGRESIAQLGDELKSDAYAYVSAAMKATPPLPLETTKRNELSAALDAAKKYADSLGKVEQYTGKRHQLMRVRLAIGELSTIVKNANPLQAKRQDAKKTAESVDTFLNEAVGRVQIKLSELHRLSVMKHMKTYIHSSHPSLSSLAQQLTVKTDDAKQDAKQKAIQEARQETIINQAQQDATNALSAFMELIQKSKGLHPDAVESARITLEGILNRGKKSAAPWLKDPTVASTGTSDTLNRGQLDLHPLTVKGLLEKTIEILKKTEAESKKAPKAP